MRNAEDSLGNLLMQISKKRRAGTNTLLAGLNIHSGQDMLLYYLSMEDGQTLSSLVEKMDVQHATMSNMVDRMVASGLVEKIKGTIDKRVSRVFITEKGRKAFDTVADAWDTMEDRSTKGLSVIEKFMLKRFLDRILVNLS